MKLSTRAEYGIRVLVALAHAEGDRPTMLAFRAGHACGDGGKHQDAFQALAEDKNSNIQKSHR